MCVHDIIAGTVEMWESIAGIYKLWLAWRLPCRKDRKKFRALPTIREEREPREHIDKYLCIGHIKLIPESMSTGSPPDLNQTSFPINEHE